MFQASLNLPSTPIVNVMTTDERTHLLCATLAAARAPHAARATPPVGGGQIVVRTIKARIQQRAPDAIDHPLAAELAQPWQERLVLEIVVAAAQLAGDDEPGEPQSVEEREGREPEKIADAVERVHLPVDPEAHAH